MVKAPKKLLIKSIKVRKVVAPKVKFQKYTPVKVSGPSKPIKQKKQKKRYYDEEEDDDY
jgi:hypothetical protein